MFGWLHRWWLKPERDKRWSLDLAGGHAFLSPEETATVRAMLRSETEWRLIPREVIATLFNDRLHLMQSVEKAKAELGVPDGTYAAPVANAYQILAAAVAART